MSALSDVLLSKIDVIIVMGVSGSGKTTVGNNLANSLKWHYKDGDDFHSDANVAKMASGHYMPPELLDSQLSTLEDPSGEEDVIPIEIMEEQDPSVLNDVIKERLLKSF
ncbi:hypothetical protein GCK32_021806 [Trichostrongylus colubriformis]|uniref:gluconokinase n=1 Tax=Trichostrongylus colubriformis TaxID=6319 RepID=A0AAN8EZB6_TRICO